LTTSLFWITVVLIMRQKIITQKKLAGKLRLSPSHLCEILGGLKRPSSKKASQLERVSGVGRMIWLYGSKSEIKRELERAFGKINFGRGRP